MTSFSPEPLYGHTNVSQPKLQYTGDQHSITASEDYYSLSSSSDNSNDFRTREQIRRYTTPPSRYRTPMQSGERLPRETSRESRSTPMRGPGRRRASDSAGAPPLPHPLSSNPRVSPVRRKPVPSTVFEGNSPESVRNSGFGNTQSSASKEIDREPSPPTPEDNTPYIHFALDQLTRDEEVRGSRFYPGQGEQDTRRQRGGDAPAAPVVAVVADQSRPLAESPAQQRIAPTAVDHREQARQRLEGRGERVVHHHVPAEAAGAGLVAAQPFAHVEERTNHRELPSQKDLPSEVAVVGQGGPIAALTPPPAPITPERHPEHSISRDMKTTRRSEPDLLVPFEPLVDSAYEPLRTLPRVLRPLQLGLFIFFLLVLLALLLLAAIWSRIHVGLWDYATFGDARYFVFQYLPTLLGMILLLWLFEIEIALYRVAPFLALASDSPKARSHGALLPLYPTGFTLPSFCHFAAGQPAIGTFLFISWLTLFTVPLLSTSFNVYQISGRWIWLATQGVIWTVVVLYIFLLISSIWLMAFLWRKETGLKWDPRSLADILVVLERSNLLDAYFAFYDFVSVTEFRDQVELRGDRLGYWRSSQRPNDIFQTFGAPNQPARRYSIEAGKLVEKPVGSAYQPNRDPESGRPYSHGTVKSLLPKRWSKASSTETIDHYEYLPWFLWPTFVIVWAITAIVLLIAFLVVSYLPATAIRSGFLPDLPVPVNSSGFSSPNFLYSFIPSLLGLLCLLFWYSIDLSLRRLQPYASLTDPRGAVAERSLLLSYPSDGLVIVTIKALVNRHFRVALTSFTTLIASTLPILGGGVFWAQFYIVQQRVRISGHMPAFYALTVILCIYALSYFGLPITSRQASNYSIPANGNASANKARSLVDVIGLTHQSRLLSDVAFRAPESRIQLVTRLLSAPGVERLSQISGQEMVGAGSKVSLADSVRGFGGARQAAIVAPGGFETARFGLGKYLGRNGREYIGIDRVNRAGDGGVHVRAVKAA